MTTNYIPSQGDIIWIDFDSSIGREIQKRRPGLVVFNAATKFAVICPSTSTMKRYTLKNSKTQGASHHQST